METGRASKTAFRVAVRRAVHQVLDKPCILDDPIAVPLLGRAFTIDRQRESHPIAMAFRAFMATRSRYAEDRLAVAIASGVTQYVILGAGLDTFAYRNPFPSVRVFEVDSPATQQWKRGLLQEAAIPLPSNLSFVPLDFEHKTLLSGLSESGFDARQPAFFGWLGVAPYLTLDAFRSTLLSVAQLPSGTTVTFDYALSPSMLGPAHRAALATLAARVSAAGEPFQTFFTPDELAAELRACGFQRMEQADSAQLNEMYFRDRADHLKLPTPGLGMIATAWV